MEAPRAQQKQRERAVPAEESETALRRPSSKAPTTASAVRAKRAQIRQRLGREIS